MNSERRSIHRERPEELSYIQFEPGGGGIVLDASERGLAFQAATAVRLPGQVRISISPNPKQLIGLTAEIVWMDQTNRSGGLRFVELTEDTRNQICRWLTKTGETETPDIKPELPSRVQEGDTDSCAGPQNSKPEPLEPELPSRVQEGDTDSCAGPQNSKPEPLEPELLSRVQEGDTDSCAGPRNSKPEPLEPTAALRYTLPANANKDVDSTSAPRSFGFGTKALWPEPFSEEKQAAFSRARLLRGVATGFLVLVFLSVPVLFSQDFRSGLGDFFIRVGVKLKSKSHSSLEASSSSPVQDSSLDSGGKSSVPKPKLDTPPEVTQNPADATAATDTNRRTADPLEPSHAPRQNPPQRFVDAHSRGGRSAYARQLWSALGAGDSSAEVPLAELYLKGDGVPKNCQQAAVLLRAASKNGNVEAREKLKNLKKIGCR
jgi:hypothetical protein